MADETTTTTTATEPAAATPPCQAKAQACHPTRSARYGGRDRAADLRRIERRVHEHMIRRLQPPGGSERGRGRRGVQADRAHAR